MLLRTASLLGRYEINVDACNNRVNFSPKRAKRLLLGGRQFFERICAANPAQVGVGLPVLERLFHLESECGISACRLLAPMDQIGFEPFERLLAQLGACCVV